MVGGKYFTRRGGESHAVREFCVVYKLERAKEFVQDMELRFNQAVNNFLASKWGQTGERLEWVGVGGRLIFSESGCLIASLCLKWHCWFESWMRKSK